MNNSICKKRIRDNNNSRPWDYITGHVTVWIQQNYYLYNFLNNLECVQCCTMFNVYAIRKITQSIK